MEWYVDQFAGEYLGPHPNTARSGIGAARD